MAYQETDSGFREEARLALEALVDGFVVKGGKTTDVLDVLVVEIGMMREAYSRDPDPADDDRQAALREPSNDWPAAESEETPRNDW